MDEPFAKLTLVDAFLPQLTAGEYTLSALQTLYVEVEQGRFAWVEKTARKVFHVAAPRFALAPDEIHSRYPADGHTGAFHDTVPHVVFRRQTLPWERPLVPNEQPTGGAVPPDPWMALLVFDAAELPETPFVPRTLDEVVAPEPAAGAGAVRGPAIALDPWEAHAEAGSGDEPRRCVTLDLPFALFRAVAPRRSELRFLAHARQVATHSKEDLFGVGDGWFSVVLANRLPADGRRSLAALVSLEGLQDLIEDTAPAGVATVRLVVLAHWAFVSDGKPFGDVARALTENKDPWLRVGDGAEAADAAVGTALGIGCVPLRHHLRDGGVTVSWYHGPLTPAHVTPATAAPIFENADEALQFDAETGLFDASHAAAWQLGRLLALRSGDFARDLSGFMRGHAAEAIVREAHAALAAAGPEETDADRAARMRRATAAQRDDFLAALVLEWSGE
jgi:hypothetical protein